MALQRTAYEACSRKVHCVTKRYLDDPYVAAFTKDITIVNSPLMNRGTWLRTQAIENCVLEFVAHAAAAAASTAVDGDDGNSRSGGGRVQIISLGAGVDTLYFRLAQHHPDVRFAAYVELDLPDLVAEKRRVLTRQGGFGGLVRDDYVLVAADLRQPSATAAVLQQHVRPGVPTLLLAEMVLVYLDADVAHELLRTLVDDVLGGVQRTPQVLVTYDAIAPHDRFGQTMVDTLAARQVHLCSIAALNSPAAHAQRSRRLGFADVQAMTMRQLYLRVPLTTRRWLDKLEMIDDWDEWNLVHDHYCFVVARTAQVPALQIFAPDATTAAAATTTTTGTAHDDCASTQPRR